MVLKNYWRWLKAITEYNPGYSNESIDIGLIDISGTSALMALGGTPLDRVQRGVGLNRMLTSYFSVRVGSGTTEITSEDYALSNDITDSLSSLSYSLSQSSEDGVSRTITVTGANLSGSEITISQAGYCKLISPTYNQADWAYVMFAATTLAEPLTVANGDSFTITLEWNEM